MLIYSKKIYYQAGTALGTGNASANKIKRESNLNTFTSLWRKSDLNKMISDNEKELEDCIQQGDVMR